MEAALASYFELVIKLRRVDRGVSTEAQERAKPLWDKIKLWGPRLEEMDKQVNTGVRLLGHAKKVIGLLDYIPM